MHPDCKRCLAGQNGINGRFCILTQKYVEHLTKKICTQPVNLKRQSPVELALNG